MFPLVTTVDSVSSLNHRHRGILLKKTDNLEKFPIIAYTSTNKSFWVWFSSTWLSYVIKLTWGDGLTSELISYWSGPDEQEPLWVIPLVLTRTSHNPSFKFLWGLSKWSWECFNSRCIPDRTQQPKMRVSVPNMLPLHAIFQLPGKVCQDPTYGT